MSADESDRRLTAHLAAYLGIWPPSRPVEIVAWSGRLDRAWDGALVPAAAVFSPVGTVVSVPPDRAARAASLASAGPPLSNAFRRAVGIALDAPNRVSPWVVLRWSTQPAPLADVGQWVDADHPALPEWLRAFAGPVLVTLDDEGRYVAGVGIKDHTRWGRELAVGTEPEARGRGLARRLVAQAARAVLDDGALPLYVHHPDNIPSARVADAAGFPDRGWRLLAVWGG